jgi:dienelactone hydrolase
LLAAPAITPPLELGAEKNIAYTKPLQAEVHEQMVDIYYPNKEGPWPVVLILPRMSPNRGGLAYVKLAQTIAGQGAVVFLPDYGTMDIYFPMKAAENNGRLFRQTHEEIACLLQTIQAKAAQFGGDPENTILVGHDTGGLYALDAALLGTHLTKRWDEFAAKRGGPQAQVECLDAGEPAKVKAVVSYAGLFFYLSNVRDKDAEVAALIDPLELAGGDDRPNITLMAIMSDPDIPVEPSLKVRDGLTDAGYAVEFYPLYIASTNVTSSGDELNWIMNAALQSTK